MKRQTYLLRKAGRYYFRRRLPCRFGSSRPITLSLGTAEPVEAGRLARRLAVTWDELSKQMRDVAVGERRTLSAEEQMHFFQQGLKEELEHATRHLTDPQRGAGVQALHSKILSAAYRIIGSIDNSAEAVTEADIVAQIDASWTPSEIDLLKKTLAIYVTPTSVCRSDIKDALAHLKVPINAGTVSEARWNIFRGKSEAQQRALLADHDLFRDHPIPALALCDDDQVRAARTVQCVALPAVATVHTAVATEPPVENETLFAKVTSTRFSEHIDDVLALLVRKKGYQPDTGQRRRVLETFAWISGDKPMSSYTAEDRNKFVEEMSSIPTDLRFGQFGKSGLMAAPYDRAEIPQKTKDTTRSARTINRDLSILAAVEDQLQDTVWRPKYGNARVIDFRKACITIKDDPFDPKRVPHTPDHLRVLYSLGIWQGGGGSTKRLKQADSPRVYQDAAYWLPLLGTYTGVAREEGAGFEIDDFNFECEVPFVIIQANMTRSKDGETKAGLKRLSRHRVMPLHPELLRLGLQQYVEAVAKEGHTMIFPELYMQSAKHAAISANGMPNSKPLKAPAFGGRRFYAIAWCFIIDATHAVLPLPETSAGKKADFHSQRTYNNSVLAAPDISQAIIDKHMGHGQKGTGPKVYNRRSLALGEVLELRERLSIMVEQMPIVTDHIRPATDVQLLPLAERSRVGSADGRDAKRKFCA